MKQLGKLLGAIACWAGIGVNLAVVPAVAQSSSVEQVAHFVGSDRDQKLAEGAKREGEVSLYSSLPQDDNIALTEAFEAKYGLRVRVWRSGSETLLQRVLTETRANRFDADVVFNNAVGLEPLQREKLLQGVASPHLADLLPQAIPPHREWVAVYLNTFVLAHNVNLVPKNELPKSYRELLDSRWKGRLGIEAEDFDWFAEVVQSLGEAEGVKLFRDIVRTNGISVRKGHTLLTNLVAAGEVPLALTVYSYSAEQMKSKGAPLDWFVIPPAVARPNGVAVLKSAPHPHAAVLFYDFVLGEEGQAILAKRNFVVTNRKVQTSLDPSDLKIVDSRIALDESRKWQDLFAEVVLRPAR